MKYVMHRNGHGAHALRHAACGRPCSSGLIILAHARGPRRGSMHPHPRPALHATRLARRVIVHAKPRGEHDLSTPQQIQHLLLRLGENEVDYTETKVRWLVQGTRGGCWKVVTWCSAGQGATPPQPTCLKAFTPPCGLPYNRGSAMHPAVEVT